MTDHTRPFAVATFGLLAALGAVIAITAAVFHSFAGCAVGLVVLGAAALAAYRAARAAEVRTDQLVLQQLRQDSTLDEHALAAGLGLRPAAIRLSLHRLSQNDDLPQTGGPSDDRN
ncbi:hypothetical protein [Streptomyces sp. TLI_171]|uniref:hypothetical protein n=1 Tax=Streptomyces sp. TLI_171 TaxID=1938859 RepID=UPI000C196C6E|nr:hypothetical protein [Streptomyces sp. TLI_171]RKE21978.1 hypothetical protein BX266_5386 [Streptomyces sp. TLI_171]